MSLNEFQPDIYKWLSMKLLYVIAQFHNVRHLQNVSTVDSK